MCVHCDTGAVHRSGHLWRHPASGRHEGQQGHCSHQQGRRGANLPGRRLWDRGRSIQGTVACRTLYSWNVYVCFLHWEMWDSCSVLVAPARWSNFQTAAYQEICIVDRCLCLDLIFRGSGDYFVSKQKKDFTQLPLKNCILDTLTCILV